MSRVDDVGERDGWRCWLCDEPVDPQMSVNDPRGPSVDSITAKSTSSARKAKAPVVERLAHRACNTKKGAVAAIAPWSADLFVFEPAPIIETVQALRRKGGRTIVAHCPTRPDALAAGAWLTDRVSRLAPDFQVTADVEPGAGQFLLVLRA